MVTAGRLAAWDQRSLKAGPGCPRISLGSEPGLPTEWTRVLERNPEAMNPEPLPGYVWLDVPGKVLHVRIADLEIQS
jgi:hypothetical protein